MLQAISEKIDLFGRFVAFSHTIFALPFALAMLVVLHFEEPVSLGQLALILLALVAARSFAMAFNRIVDRHVDAKNPRTANRELPANSLPLYQAYIFFATNLGLFFLAAGLLGLHCLLLAPLVVVVLCGYSYTKRFTTNAHFVLGLALACAPGGVWYALRGTFDWEPVYLMLAVLLWVAGFDIIYSCQDVSFDKRNQLHSIPSKLGVKNALLTSRVLHVLSVLMLCIFGYAMELSLVYYLGISIFAGILFSQHTLVSESDLRNVNKAFFARNGAASFIFLLTVLSDQLLALNASIAL